MKKWMLGLMAFLLLACSANAQKLQIQNIKKSAQRASGAIKEGAEVKGYYFFYVNDKVDKKTNEYSLQIFDNNLKMLKDIKFTESNKVTILESSFNGKDLIFLFYNSDERTLDYRVYGADGNRKPFNYSRELTKKEKAYLQLTYLSMDDDEETYKGLYPVDNIGFISNMPSREGNDYTFQIDFFATDKRKQWTFVPPGDDSKRCIGDYLGYSNGVVYFEVLKLKGLMDQKPDSYILGLSLETGKQLFEKPSDGKFRFYPSSLAVLNNGKTYLFGEYFNQNGNVMKDKSLGYAFWSMDESGKITSEKYCSWESDISKFVDVSATGKIDDFGYFFLHRMLQASDGNIYAIGEGFKKVASALGIASKVLAAGGQGGGVSAVKARVTDMAIIKFDQDFNIKGMTFYKKNSNNIELKSGMEFVSVPLMGKMLKYNYGGFDYSYTQYDKDVTTFSVCYEDFIRSKEYKGSTFNSITFTEGKFTTDKINTSSSATRSWILPGKTGQVLVLDYYKKDKKLEGHFEKLN